MKLLSTLAIVCLLGSLALAQDDKEQEWEALHGQIFSAILRPKNETLDLLIKLRDLSAEIDPDGESEQVKIVEGLIKVSQLSPENCSNKEVRITSGLMTMFKTHANIYVYLKDCFEDRLLYCLESYDRELRQARDELSDYDKGLIGELAGDYMERVMKGANGLNFMVNKRELAVTITKILEANVPTLRTKWEGFQKLKERVLEFVGYPCKRITKGIEHPSVYFGPIMRRDKIARAVSKESWTVLVAERVCSRIIYDAYNILHVIKDDLKPKNFLWSMFSRDKN